MGSVPRETISAVILAGGSGVRLREVLPEWPKPMAIVAGRPFLEWVIRYLAAQGIRRFILSTGYLGEVIESHFSGGLGVLDISCVREPTPLDTAGGFLNCVAAADARPAWWMVCNGDSLTTADLGDLLSGTAAETDVAGAMLGVEVADTGRYGSLTVSASGVLEGFAEKRSGRGIINTGVYLFRDEFVRALGRVRPLSFEREVFPAAVEDGVRLRVAVTHGAFLDIGTPAALAQAGDFVETAVRPLLSEDKVL